MLIRIGFDSEAAARLAATGGGFAARSGVTAVVPLGEQPLQQAGTLGATVAVAATNRGFTTASGVDDFATAGGFRRAARGVTAAAPLGEQARQQTGLLAVRVASDFAATRRCGNRNTAGWLAATSGLRTTGVTALIMATEEAGRSVRRGEGGEGEGEQNRGDYTTHRGGLQRIGFPTFKFKPRYARLAPSIVRGQNPSDIVNRPASPARPVEKAWGILDRSHHWETGRRVAASTHDC